MLKLSGTKEYIIAIKYVHFMIIQVVKSFMALKVNSTALNQIVKQSAII